MKYNKKMLALMLSVGMLGAVSAYAQNGDLGNMRGMGGGMEIGMGRDMGPGLDFMFDADKLTQKFTDDANLLGITVDEAKNAWVNGKSIFELAQEKGISTSTLQAKLDTLRNAKLKSDLQTLVTKGILTQAQADTKYNQIITKQQEMQNKVGKKMKKQNR